MKKISKFLAVMLAVLMIVPSFAALASAADTCTCGHCPTIFVTGIGNEEIYANLDEADEKIVFPPDTDKILDAVMNIILPVGFNALTDGWDGVADALLPTVGEIAGEFAMNADGTTPDGQGIKWEWPTGMSANNHEKSYEFKYDWREDPVKVAEDLADYVDYIKTQTGHEQVSFIGFSLGSAILNAYLYELDGDYTGIKSVIMEVAACNGVTCCGQPLNGDVAFDAASLVRFIDDMIASESGIGSLGSVTLQALAEAGVISVFTDFANTAVAGLADRLYSDDDVIGAFASLPAFWALIPHEYYESAKASLLSDTEKYADLIEMIDYYHYNIQQTNNARAVELYEDADISFGIISKYGLQVTPVVEDSTAMSDGVVDTRFSSFGATCAPVDETFDDDYVQADTTTCTDNHISADRMIDASTCAVPEATWFIKDLQHSANSDYVEQLEEFICTYDGQPTVWSDAAFPQFALYDKEADTTAPLTEDNTGELYDWMSEFGFSSNWAKILVKLVDALTRLFGGLFGSKPVLT